MARTRAFAFGPGSLEDVTLRTRVATNGYRRTQARIVGTYRVYCGMGNEHTVDVTSQYVNAHDILALRPVVAKPVVARCGRADEHGAHTFEDGHRRVCLGNRDNVIRGIAHVMDLDEAERDTIARELVEWTLEDWADPCDTGDDEEIE